MPLCLAFVRCSFYNYYNAFVSFIHPTNNMKNTNLQSQICTCHPIESYLNLKPNTDIKISKTAAQTASML